MNCTDNGPYVKIKNTLTDITDIVLCFIKNTYVHGLPNKQIYFIKNNIYMIISFFNRYNRLYINLENMFMKI